MFSLKHFQFKRKSKRAVTVYIKAVFQMRLFSLTINEQFTDPLSTVFDNKTDQHCKLYTNYSHSLVLAKKTEKQKDLHINKNVWTLLDI